MSLIYAMCAFAQVGPNQSELTGYNAKRHEFDPEFDPDAELIIAELEFREEDTPVRLECTILPVWTARNLCKDLVQKDGPSMELGIPYVYKCSHSWISAEMKWLAFELPC